MLATGRKIGLSKQSPKKMQPETQALNQDLADYVARKDYSVEAKSNKSTERTRVVIDMNKKGN